MRITLADDAGHVEIGGNAESGRRPILINCKCTDAQKSICRPILTNYKLVLEG